MIPILNDVIGGEGDETFTVTLTPGAGYVLGATGTATVTIHDDDIPPESAVQFSQPKYLVMENGLNAVLTVNRVDVGGGFGLAATVKYATVAGTALAASDYIAPALATAVLNWAIGDNGAKTIMIPIVNNTIAEPTESFKVVLSGAVSRHGPGCPERGDRDDHRRRRGLPARRRDAGRLQHAGRRPPRVGTCPTIRARTKASTR